MAEKSTISARIVFRMDSPTSSSRTSMDILPIPRAKCQICFQSGHGKHFGAFSCRACSAFFRRAVVGKYHTFMCVALDGKCKAKSDGQFVCKRCRVQRCYDVGMKPEKVQYNRDPISSTENIRKTPKTITTIAHSPEVFLGRPSFIFSCEPDLASSSKTIIDLQILIDRATNIFTTHKESRINKTMSGMNTLDRLVHAFDLSRIPSTDKPIFLYKIGKEEKMFYWEGKFLAAANWLTYCDEFQKLPIHFKIDLLKSIWTVWTRLEKIGKQVERRQTREDILTRKCHIMNNVFIEIGKVKFDNAWMTNYRPDQVPFFPDDAPANRANTLDPLLNMSATPQEITYLTCIVSFRLAAKQHSGKIAELSEILIDKLADDLHSHYSNDQKLRNYATRMGELLKIARFIENDIYERKQKVEIARLFDVYTFEFSHPEMFIGV